MANDDTPAGFFSRWSRRKIDVREGRELDEPQLSSVSAPGMTQPVNSVVSAASAVSASDEADAKPLPTMADAQQLTPDSDFKGFMTQGVAPDVKNVAMKKLFADPHFNVMDGMDIYIDDYSQPDPLPLAMLRKMTSAQTLNLFDEESGSAEKAIVQAGDIGESVASTPMVVVPSGSTEHKTSQLIEPQTKDS